MDGRGNSYPAGKAGAARKGNNRSDTDFDLADELYTDDKVWSVDELDLPDISTDARRPRDPYRSTSRTGTADRKYRPAGNAQQARRQAGNDTWQARRPAGTGTQATRRPSGSSAQGTRRPYGDSAQGTRRPSGSDTQPERRTSRDNTGTERRQSGSSTQGTGRSSGSRQPERRPSGSDTQPERRTSRDNTERERRQTGGRKQPETENRRSREKDFEKKKSGLDVTKMTASPLFIGAAAGVLLIIILVIVGTRSCSNSHKSSENVVKELITAFVNGDEKKMKDSYGISGDVTVDVQEELDAAGAYYKAHNAKKMEVTSTGTLFSEGKYTYVYIVYDLILENDERYPCIGTYIVENLEDKYYVLTPSKVTEDLSEKATEAYRKFMTTETYKQYTIDYETFIKKNPGYEDKIASKLI